MYVTHTNRKSISKAIQCDRYEGYSNFRFTCHAIGVSFGKKGMVMKRILLAVMLVLASTSAMAGGNNWTAIGDGRDFPVSYYLDFKTIQKQGQYVNVLELMDFDTPQEFKDAAWVYFSSVLRIEFDCKNKQSRILSFRMYAGKMATKDMVYSASFPSATWEPVPPGSVTKELWNSACLSM